MQLQECINFKLTSTQNVVFNYFRGKLAVLDVTPIQYALTWPERENGAAAELDIAEAGALHFYRQDEEAFPSTNLARRALAKGGTATAAFNAADEIAVAAFLKGKIKFTDIPRIIEKTIEVEFTKGNSFDEVFYTDCEARKFASELVR